MRARCKKSLAKLKMFFVKLVVAAVTQDRKRAVLAGFGHDLVRFRGKGVVDDGCGLRSSARVRLRDLAVRKHLLGKFAELVSGRQRQLSYAPPRKW